MSIATADSVGARAGDGAGRTAGIGDVGTAGGGKVALAGKGDAKVSGRVSDGDSGGGLGGRGPRRALPLHPATGWAPSRAATSGS